MFTLRAVSLRFANRLLLAAAICAVLAVDANAEECCKPASWVFKRSTFTHDPETGARVAQYDRHAPVEELPDPRLVTSGYRRTRTNLRGADGSVDSYYQVQSWGNGRGGLDAEWERFHDAWRGSYLSGGYYQGAVPYGYGGGYGFGGGYGYGGFGVPGAGFGNVPGWGSPGFGGVFAPGYLAPRYPPAHGRHGYREWPDESQD